MTVHGYWMNYNFAVNFPFVVPQVLFFALFGSKRKQFLEGLDAGGVHHGCSGGLLVRLHPEPKF